MMHFYKRSEEVSHEGGCETQKLMAGVEFCKTCKALSLEMEELQICMKDGGKNGYYSELWANAVGVLLAVDDVVPEAEIDWLLMIVPGNGTWVVPTHLVRRAFANGWE